MSETPSEKHAHEILQAEGFVVERIPPGETRTADFRVTDGRFSYLVEVTGKQEGGFMVARRAEAHAKGVADGTRKLHYNNTLDGVIREKAKQLAETPKQADFRVLWIAAFHGDWQFLWRLLNRTLFGLARLRVEQERPEIRECLYYHHSSFLRLPHLDAVVFSTENCGCLFVNAQSTRAEAFRSSKLYARFRGRERLDPSEAPESVLVVDPSVDRSRPLSQWRYLKEHYGLMTSEMMEVEMQGILSTRLKTTDDQA